MTNTIPCLNCYSPDRLTDHGTLPHYEYPCRNCKDNFHKKYGTQNTPKTSVFFSVDKYGSCLYLYEKLTGTTKLTHPAIRDLIQEPYALEKAFCWDHVPEFPNKIGLYEAIVEIEQTTDRNINIYVISIEPIHTLDIPCYQRIYNIRNPNA